MSHVTRRSQDTEIPSSAPAPTSNGNRSRSYSAPARLGGNSFVVTNPVKKQSVMTPTPEEMGKTEEAYSNYVAALAQQKNEKSSFFSFFTESKAKQEVQKAASQLGHVYKEDFYLDQAIKDSKQEFRKQIADAGGNPDIAEEVFREASGISDFSSTASHHAQAAAAGKSRSTQKSTQLSTNDSFKTGSLSPDKLSDVEEAELDDDSRVWRDVDPSATQGNQGSFEKTSAAPLSLENFFTRLDSLSQKEITDFINSLSAQEIKQLATSQFEEPSFIQEMSLHESKTFLISVFSEAHKQAQLQIPLTSPQATKAITEAFLKRPAPIEHQGLHNSGVDCYLSSALQCLRRHFSSLPRETQQVVLASLRSKYESHLGTLPLTEDNITTVSSPLVAFLEGKFDGRNHFAASFLRKEVQRVMQELSQSGENPSAAATEMAAVIDPITGNSQQQCDTSEALVALMEYLETPRVLLEERDTYHATGQVRLSDNQQARQHGGELIVPCGIEKESSLQEVIHSNFIADLTGPEAVEDPNGSKHDIHRERALVNPPDSITISLSRFRMKPNPEGGWAQNSRGEEILGVPKLAVDNLGRPIREKLHTPISHLTDNITLPTRDHDGAQTETTYAPSSIICHYGGESANSGHYATYRKEGEEWFLVNDAQVTPVNLDHLMADRGGITHRQFLERNAYVVSLKQLADHR